MQPNTTDFKWDRKRDKAALEVAQDDRSDAEIAAALKIDKTTLERWKRHPVFRVRVQQHIDDFREAIKAEGIANRQNRVDYAKDRHRRLQQIMDERAAAMAGEHPGAGTGLLVHQVKVLGAGRNAITIDEYALDTSLLKEMREHEKQVAQDLQQWNDKGSGLEEKLTREYVGVDITKA